MATLDLRKLFRERCYAISARGQSAGNYAISYISGTLNVTPASLTVTVDADPNTAAQDPFSKVYGAVNPAFSVRYARFVNGDTAASLSGTLSFITPANNGSAAGSYTVSASGQTSSNYAINYVAGVLNIIPTEKIGVHRGDLFYLDVNGNGKWDSVAGGDITFRYGNPGDESVVGDWNGSGTDKVGVHQADKFYLDVNGNGKWDNVAGGDNVVRFGNSAGDTGIAGNWKPTPSPLFGHDDDFDAMFETLATGKRLGL